jgi:tetratricopeptide (TPR) repeat protein
MKRLFAKMIKAGWFGGIALGVFSLISCGNDNASLIITQCLDQDNAPLAQEVVITIGEVSKIWKPGTVCEFQIAFANGRKKEITLEADAGVDFFNYSRRQYVLAPKQSMKIPLRFFKAYTIDITAVGADDLPLAGVMLSVDGDSIGLTDQSGSYSWRVGQPSVKPEMKAGYQMKVELGKDGAKAFAQPFILAKGKFVYKTQGKLNVTEKPQSGRLASIGKGRATTLEEKKKTLPSEPQQTLPKKKDKDAVTKNPNIALPSPNSGFISSGFIKEGDQAAEAGNYEAAIAAYGKIPNPGMAGNSQAVREYIEAQYRSGVLYWKQLQLRNYEQAIQSFQNIIDIDPRAYYAFYNLAGVYYEIDDFVRCRNYCDQVIRLKQTIPVEDLIDTELQMRYLKAICQYQLYQRDPDVKRKRQMGLKCLSELRDFIGLMPADKSKFQEEQQDAKQKIKEIEAQMSQF